MFQSRDAILPIITVEGIRRINTVFLSMPSQTQVLLLTRAGISLHMTWQSLGLSLPDSIRPFPLTRIQAARWRWLETGELPGGYSIETLLSPSGHSAETLRDMRHPIVEHLVECEGCKWVLRERDFYRASFESMPTTVVVDSGLNGTVPELLRPVNVRSAIQFLFLCADLKQPSNNTVGLLLDTRIDKENPLASILTNWHWFEKFLEPPVPSVLAFDGTRVRTRQGWSSWDSYLKQGQRLGSRLRVHLQDYATQIRDGAISWDEHGDLFRRAVSQLDELLQYPDWDAISRANISFRESDNGSDETVFSRALPPLVSWSFWPVSDLAINRNRR